MTTANRVLLGLTLFAAPLALQAQETQNNPQQGWGFSQRFQGSSNAAGVILKTNSTAIYSFNEHVNGYMGVPLYFAKQTSSTGSTDFMNGLGNVYLGFLVSADAGAIRYSSDLVGTAPTGDRSRGF